MIRVLAFPRVMHAMPRPLLLALLTVLMPVSTGAQTPQASLQQLRTEMAATLGVLAQDQLASSRLASPMPCLAHWVINENNIILIPSNVADTAGLKVGDVLLRIGLTPLSASVDWEAAMRRLSPGLTSYNVEVRRQDGQAAPLSLPCASAEANQAQVSERAMWTAVTRQQWPTCIKAGQEVTAAYNAMLSPILRVMSYCATLANESDETRAAITYMLSFAHLAEWVALPSPPTGLREEIISGLRELEIVRLSGGKDYTTELRQAMQQVNFEAPAFSAAELLAPATADPIAFTGTGFVVNASGPIVTANHVVDGASTISAKCGSGPPLDATVISRSATLDLAMLGVKASGLPFLEVAKDVSAVQLGTQVFTIGFPATTILGSDAKFTEGTISGLSGVAGDASFFQVSVPIQPGNSGGPLIDQRGRVVGVLLATADAPIFMALTGALPQNVNWAVKSPMLLGMFTGAASQPATASREEIIKRAVAATCFITAVK